MTKIYELSNEMLSEVAGGSGPVLFGSPIIRNPNEYYSAGVRIDWSRIYRTFYFGDEIISENVAAAIVFCKYCGYLKMCNESKPSAIIAKAYQFKKDNLEAYYEFIRNVNV